MTEWIIIGVILLIIPVTIAMIRISWNVAKGGTDLLELLGNAGRPGTSRERSNREINERKKSKIKKWDINGKKK